MNLRWRDESAIAYHKSLLLEGDTIVLISYPGDAELYDPAGFKISSNSHRVHSNKLLATGSSVFEKLLGHSAQQRAQKRAGYTTTNPLPTGVKYVLDLTPPVEGDEAVELTSDLSCPLGIRHWATTVKLLEGDSRLVNGRDEYTKSYNYPAKDEDGDMSPTGNYAVHPEDIPEYCPVRHRAGIERLLRIIEGQDPRLDSAPKIWTLAVLAKYFDCKKIVAGFIDSWVMTEPNNTFIEILPEAAFMIGLYVESKMIIEPAFTVLVSEGAFRIASRMRKDFDPTWNSTSQFGRPKGDINEDELSRIQAAANDFHSRVSGVASNLTEEKMTWLEQLPEFRKIMIFKEANTSAEAEYYIEKLAELLRHYVRGRIITVATRSITVYQSQSANIHRSSEQYLQCWDAHFQDVYNALIFGERYLTRFYWEILCGMPWPIRSYQNTTFKSALNVHSSRTHEDLEPLNAIMSVDTPDLSKAKNTFNDIMLLEISEGNFYGGRVPKECPRVKRPAMDKSQSILFWTVDRTRSEKQSSDTRETLAFTEELATSFSRNDPTATAKGKTRSVSLRELPLRPKNPPVEASSSEMKISSTELSADTKPLAANSTGDVDFEAFDLEVFNMETDDLETPADGNTPNTSLLGLPKNPPRQSPTKAKKTSTELSAGASPLAVNPTLELSRGNPPIVRPPPLTQFSVPEEANTANYAELPFFSLNSFLSQVREHLGAVGGAMLHDPYFGRQRSTDTVVCMSEEELKYLPLWAGGNEDGTGGVFEKPIPPAVFGAAPNGPGPAYHTGLSVFSQSSSIVDVDEDDQMTEIGTVNTSLAVDNGLEGHVDRRVVMSDFGSVTTADNAHDDEGDGEMIDYDGDGDNFMFSSDDEDEDFGADRPD